MHPRDHIGFLFNLLRQGLLRLKPLSHGLDSLCLEIVDNNYDRYKRLYSNLVAEIAKERKANYPDPDMYKYKTAYVMALIEAQDTIDFWMNLSKLFYDGNTDANVTTRILPDSRKLISVDSCDGGKRAKNIRHKKASKKDKLPRPRKYIR